MWTQLKSPLFISSSKRLDNVPVTSNVHIEKDKRKLKLDQSTSDGERGKELKDKESKRKKEKKEEKPVEEKYCRPGMLKFSLISLVCNAFHSDRTRLLYIMFLYEKHFHGIFFGIQHRRIPYAVFVVAF